MASSWEQKMAKFFMCKECYFVQLFYIYGVQVTVGFFCVMQFGFLKWCVMPLNNNIDTFGLFLFKLTLMLELNVWNWHLYTTIDMYSFELNHKRLITLI